MEATPVVSVVMSVYREPIDWIKESVASILQQTFSDFEFIIVNDNPGDNALCDYLRSLQVKDNRIILLYNELNIGLTKSLNRGIERAQGKYIARMDADDISYPHRFERQIEYLDNHIDVGVCGSYVELFGSKNGIVKYPVNDNEIFLFIETCCAHPSVMMRSSIFDGVRYNESMRVAQDYDLWTTFYEKGVRFGNIAEPLLKYRCSDIQITTTKAHLQINASCHIRRRAFDHYCKINNIQFNLGDDDITFEAIDKIVQLVRLPYSVSMTLNYYLLSSVSSDSFGLLIYLLRNIGTIRLRMGDVFRLFYHSITNSQIRKF